MNSKQTSRKRLRRGLSLLELVIATSMLALLMTAVSVVMRSSRQAWEAHVADYNRLEAAHATLRHIVRQVRQARSVTSISASTDDSGQLSLRMPDDTVVAWDHDDTNDTVNYGITTADNLLATEISGLRFTGYEANGTTTTTVPDDVFALRVEVTVQMPTSARTIDSWAWLRSW
jgi:prepilin-type N-terminal cleavage/methylation domain-containing protein